MLCQLSCRFDITACLFTVFTKNLLFFKRNNYAIDCRKTEEFLKWNYYSFYLLRKITRPLWYHNVQRQTSLALLKICELLNSSAKKWTKINSTQWINSPEIMGKGRLAGYLLTGHELCPQTLMEALLWNPAHSFTQWNNDANASLSPSKEWLLSWTHLPAKPIVIRTCKLHWIASRISSEEKLQRQRFLVYIHTVTRKLGPTNFLRNKRHPTNDYQVLPWITKYKNVQPKQLSDIWSNILISAASMNALQKFSSELSVTSMAHFEKKDQNGRWKWASRTLKKVKLPIRAETCYSNLNNVSPFFKFTNCNLLFYMPNLDNDTPDPITEDYLQFDEQLRIYPPKQLHSPSPHARRFYLPRRNNLQTSGMLF